LFKESFGVIARWLVSTCKIWMGMGRNMIWSRNGMSRKWPPNIWVKRSSIYPILSNFWSLSVPNFWSLWSFGQHMAKDMSESPPLHEWGVVCLESCWTTASTCRGADNAQGRCIKNCLTMTTGGWGKMPETIQIINYGRGLL
jgi:hypothetical protein